MRGFLDGIHWLFNPVHWSGTNGIPTRVWEHLQLSVISLILACLIAIPIARGPPARRCRRLFLFSARGAVVSRSL